jgi:hypothetical protein
MSDTKPTPPNGIAILVPSSGRNVCIEWAMALASLSFPVGMNHFWYISKAAPGSGHTRDKQREELAEVAIKVNAEFMMWIDDDTVPPASAVQELYYVLAQHPKAAICGGIYCTKDVPPMPIVFMELGAGPYWEWTIGDVFKCKGLGTGCMMVRTSVMKDIPKPWFKDTSEAKLGDTEMRNGIEVKIVGRSGTDDVFFAKKVSDAGYEIWAHGGVLPVHVDYATGNTYKLPKNSYPVVTYQEKLDEVNANLPEGQKKILL